MQKEKMDQVIFCKQRYRRPFFLLSTTRNVTFMSAINLKANLISSFQYVVFSFSFVDNAEAAAAATQICHVMEKDALLVVLSFYMYRL